MTQRTPLVNYRGPGVGRELFLKLENLQPFGSYKIRGIQKLMNSLDQRTLRGGFSAASAGNMGQALAFYARELEVPCTLVVPETTPDIKIDAMTSAGARIIKKPFQQVWDYVRNGQAVDLPGYFVHPTDNSFLRQGYGELLDELLEQNPNLENIIVPIGVGGLALGIAERNIELGRPVKVITVEPETAAPFYSYFQEGLSFIEREPSFIDAIGVPEVLPHLRQPMRNALDKNLIVSIAAVKKAIKELYLHHKVIAEGAGAASVAGAMLGGFSASKTACIITGGNIDENVLNDILFS